jgi:hypothetical protein
MLFINEKLIDKGQFSEVFKAKCQIVNRIVALKKVKIYEITDHLTLSCVFLKQNLNKTNQC